MSQAAERNIRENREQWHNAPYYKRAELDIEYQWEQRIWPLIQDANFDRTLELAPGHGRNTRKLAPLARELHLVDVTPSCIDACRVRFGDRIGGTRMYYYLNDGKSLPVPLSERISFFYCWDAMVHFELDVIACYLRELERVLVPGGGRPLCIIRI